MRSPASVALYVAVMAAVIVGVDVAFLRTHAWERLAVNVGVVLAFAVLYLGFRGRPWPPWK